MQEARDELLTAASIAGPTFDPTELAGQKMTALFGRAAARDFVDVYALSQRFGKAELLELAAHVDSGFDHAVFAEMIGMLHRYSDRDLSLGTVDVPGLRAFLATWARELTDKRVTMARHDFRRSGFNASILVISAGSKPVTVPPGGLEPLTPA